MPYIVFYKARYSSRSHEESLYIYDSDVLDDFPSRTQFIKNKKEDLGLLEVMITGITEINEEQRKKYEG